MDLYIEVVDKPTKKVLETVNKLLPQLSKRSEEITLSDLEEILDQPQFYLFLAYCDGNIVGMATFFFQKTFTKPQGFGHVEDVVVDNNYRNRGVGTAIIKKLCNYASIFKLNRIELTSNSKRKTANRVYQKSGFKKRETNVYVFKL